LDINCKEWGSRIGPFFKFGTSAGAGAGAGADAGTGAGVDEGFKNIQNNS